MRTWMFLLAFVLSGCTSEATMRLPTFLDSLKTSFKPDLIVKPKMSRVVTLFGEVGENSREIAQQIRTLGNSKEPIWLLINSPGGEILRGSLIITAIEQTKAPVYTVCMEMCASMAAMIFEYGDERFVAHRSMLMFHPASGGVQGEIDKSISRLLMVQKFFGKIERYVAARVGLTYDQYKLKTSQEIWLDGEDAVKSRFADKTVLVELPDDFVVLE